jgi:hypothetical protein
MQRIRNLMQTKKRSKPNAFLSVIISWCTIADVKITFPDDIDDDIEDIRELLADADKKELPK